MVTSCRRDMNPSLQPSLSELIQQQQNQIRPQQSLNTDLNGHRSNSSNNNDTNNNLNSSSLDSNPNNNLIIDYNNPFYVGNQSNQIVTPSGLNLGAMDIEYFDQFDFALPPTGASQLAVPNQTPLSTVNFDSTDQQLVNSVNSANGCMTSTASYYPNNNSNVNNHVLDLFNIDDFKMSGDSLSWNEVDYAV